MAMVSVVLETKTGTNTLWPSIGCFVWKIMPGILDEKTSSTF